MIKRLMLIFLCITMLPITYAYAEIEHNEDVINNFSFYDDFENYSNQEELYNVYSQNISEKILKTTYVDEKHKNALEIGLKESIDNSTMYYYPEQNIENGRVRLKFSVNMNDKLTGHIGFMANQTNCSLLFLKNGRIYAGCNNTLHPGAPAGGISMMDYNDGEWYDVESIIDIDNDYFNITITAPDGNVQTLEYREIRSLGGTTKFPIDGITGFFFQDWSRINGKMYIDNLSIEHFPISIENVETGHIGNIFHIEDEKIFNVSFANFSGKQQQISVKYVAESDRNGVLFEDSEDITLENEEKRNKVIKFDMNFFDVGQLKIIMDDGIHSPIQEEYNFSCVNAVDKPANKKSRVF